MPEKKIAARLREAIRLRDCSFRFEKAPPLIRTLHPLPRQTTSASAPSTPTAV